MSLIFLFITGYLVSRLSIRYNLVAQLFDHLLRGRKNVYLRFLLYLEVSAALVSMFIPNFITALTLIPIMEGLRDNFTRSFDAKIARRMTTAMALVVIYGCNIGGMGSLVGSPSNLLMVGALEVFQVAGRDKINFLSWFGWSLPLVILMVLLSWSLVAFIFVPVRERWMHLEIPRLSHNQTSSDREKIIWLVCGLWFLFWCIHSAMQLHFPMHKTYFSILMINLSWNFWDAVGLVFTIGFMILLFLPWRRHGANKRIALLQLKDCLSDIPVRGIIFVGAVLILGGILLSVGVEKWLARQIAQLIPAHSAPLLTLFIMVLFVTLATELISNTPIALVLFPLYHSLAAQLQINPIIGIMAVGVASTNAFMLPIATPVNALIFGEMKTVSLKIMILAGLLLNLTSAFLLAIFLATIIPWYYGL